MPKKENIIPQIEEIPVESLIIDKDFNPRIPKLFGENKKELAAQVDAYGGIDASKHFVQYVEKKDGLHVRGGHTLIAVAKDKGISVVPAMRCEMDAVEEQINLVTSNTGHPLSAYEQGTVYIRLRDGTTNPNDLQPGEEIRAPMEIKEIAKAVGRSHELVRQCILIRESSEPIAALIEAGVVATSVILASRSLASEKKDGKPVLDPKKQLKIIQAAIANARSEGREVASKTNFDAIKSDFVKPFKAATPPKPGKSPAGPAGHQEEETPDNAIPGADASDSGASAEQSDSPEADSTPEEPTSDQPTIGDANPALQLFKPEPPPLPVAVKAKDAKQLREAIIAAINTADAENDLEEKAVEKMADLIVKAVTVFLSPI
jgi:hypothetical protein